MRSLPRPLHYYYMLERQTALPEGFHSIAMRVFVKYTPSPGWCRMRGHDLPLSSRTAKVGIFFKTAKENFKKY